MKSEIVYYYQNSCKMSKMGILTQKFQKKFFEICPKLYFHEISLKMGIWIKKFIKNLIFSLLLSEKEYFTFYKFKIIAKRTFYENNFIGTQALKLDKS